MSSGTCLRFLLDLCRLGCSSEPQSTDSSLLLDSSLILDPSRLLDLSLAVEASRTLEPSRLPKRPTPGDATSSIGVGGAGVDGLLSLST